MSRDSGNTSVLVIDDERTFADTFTKRLLLRGYECAVAYDGRTGVALAKERTFAGVVLDLRLPDLHGAEVLRRIRALHPELPIVILTAHGTDQDEQECMSLGATAFLRKPANLKYLMELLSWKGSASR